MILKFFFKKAYGVPAIAVAVCLTLLAGCSSANTNTSNEDVPKATRRVHSMDTYMTITCYGEKCEEAADAAQAEIERLNDLLSIGTEGSEVNLLNENYGGILSSDTEEILSTALDVYEKTGGIFDVSIYPVVDLWGFTEEEKHVPEEEEIEEALSKVGSDRISVNDGILAMGQGQQIELGGIAKGYTSDRLMAIFEEYDLVSASISLGGNAQVYNTKPDGSKWKCGIKDPNNADDSSAYLGTFQAENCAVITSGPYERYFEGEDGKIYHHIIDPRTGYPAESGLKSATIVCESGILGDALSTSVFIMGLDGAIEFWKNSGYDFDMILMTDDDMIYVTENIASDFSSKAYQVEVIEK